MSGNNSADFNYNFILLSMKLQFEKQTNLRCWSNTYFKINIAFSHSFFPHSKTYSYTDTNYSVKIHLQCTQRADSCKPMLSYGEILSQTYVSLLSEANKHKISTYCKESKYPLFLL